MVLERASKTTHAAKFASDVTRHHLQALDLGSQSAVLDQSQATIAVPPDGTILTTHPNFMAALGYRIEDIQGRHHSLFVLESERAGRAYEAIWAALVRGELACPHSVAQV